MECGPTAQNKYKGLIPWGKSVEGQKWQINILGALNTGTKLCFRCGSSNMGKGDYQGRLLSSRNMALICGRYGALNCQVSCLYLSRLFVLF